MKNLVILFLCGILIGFQTKTKKQFNFKSHSKLTKADS